MGKDAHNFESAAMTGVYLPDKIGSYVTFAEALSAGASWAAIHNGVPVENIIVRTLESDASLKTETHQGYAFEVVDLEGNFVGEVHVALYSLTYDGKKWEAYLI